MKKLTDTENGETRFATHKAQALRDQRVINKRKTEQHNAKPSKERVISANFETTNGREGGETVVKQIHTERQEWVNNSDEKIGLNATGSEHETDESGLQPLLEARRKTTLKTANKRAQTLTDKRRVANARERTRVHTLGAAFDSLRRAIPCYSANQRLSKLTILKVAIAYIAALDSLNRNLGGRGESRESRDSRESNYGSMSFSKGVNECTRALQSEYGRTKRRGWVMKTHS